MIGIHITQTQWMPVKVNAMSKIVEDKEIYRDYEAKIIMLDGGVMRSRASGEIYYIRGNRTIRYTPGIEKHEFQEPGSMEQMGWWERAKAEIIIKIDPNKEYLKLIGMVNPLADAFSDCANTITKGEKTNGK